MDNSKTRGKVILMGRLGRIAEYESLRAVMRELLQRYEGWPEYWPLILGDRKPVKIVEYDRALGRIVFSHYEGPDLYLVAAEHGGIVSRDEIYATIYGFWVAERTYGQPERGRTVPGIGGRRRYRYRRSLSTYPLHRACEMVDMDEPPVRAKVKNRPSSLDDLYRMSQHIRNWKRFRKTRWNGE